MSDALADLYGPGLSAENYVERVFQLTSRLVRCVLNSHGVKDLATGQLEANFDRNLPGLANAFSAFGQFMHKYPATRFDPATNGGKPFSMRDFFSQPAFHDLDIYQEVYGPMGYRDHCFVHVPATPGKAVFVGFFRDDSIFGEEDKAVLEILQPHLANARRLALAASAHADVPLSPEAFERAGFAPRECDVIYWLTQGKSNEEIAKILRIRPDSVSRNLQAIYIKMGVEHRVAAVIHALSLAKRCHQESLGSLGGPVRLLVQTGAER
jgi:DNA-binding CsgD family transcriptional regulator